MVYIQGMNGYCYNTEKQDLSEACTDEACISFYQNNKRRSEEINALNSGAFNQLVCPGCGGFAGLFSKMLMSGDKPEGREGVWELLELIDA